MRAFFKKAYSKVKSDTFIPLDIGVSWRWVNTNGVYYYALDRVPVASRSKLPETEAILNAYREFTNEVKPNPLDVIVRTAVTNDFAHWIACYPGLRPELANGLAKACATLEVSVDYVHKYNVNTRRSEFFVDLGTIIDKYRIPYLPKNWRRVKDKIMQVLNLPDGQGISDIVVPPRQGNSNALKFDDPEITAWIHQLRNQHLNYTDAFIIRKVRLACMMTTKPAPSESWFRNIFAQPATKQLTVNRYGSKGKHGAKFREYIPVQTALFAGDCWQMDGTRINFIGHKADNGKIEYLYIIAVRDVHSGDILGIHLDTKEDRWGYVHALKMAVTEAGYLPYELVHDRFPGHNTPEWKIMQSRLSREGVKVTTTSAATGKALTERWFGTLQTVFMAESPYYYGEGVQSTRPYAHRAQEYIKAMSQNALKEGWDFDSAWREATKVVGNYRDTPLNTYSRKYASIDKSPRQLHQESEKPHSRTLDDFRFVELFGLEKEVTIRSGGLIRTDVQRVEYVYTVSEYETILNHTKVRLCYDLDDMGRVYLFANNDDLTRQYLGEAIEQRALQLYGPNAQMKELGEAKKRITDLRERRKADLVAITSQGSNIETLLASAYANKEEQGAAETAWLEEYADTWQDKKGVPRLPVVFNDDDDQDFEIDVRNMY